VVGSYLSIQAAIRTTRNQISKLVTSQESTVRTEFKRCLIVVCAYNEEKSLPCLLQSLKGREVLVVDDGSLDKTREIAAEYRSIVLAHDTRCGKAAALADGISYALQNSYDIVVEIGADAIPRPGTLQKILTLLNSNDVGGVSCRQVPIGRPNLAYYIDELIWSILAKGKKIQMERYGSSHLGAVMFGFKPALVDSVEGSVNDDEQVGISIQEKGYSIYFAEDAVVSFDASSCIGHLFERRKRMYYGHMKFSESTAPSMQVSTSMLALCRAVIERPKRAFWILPTMVLDFSARLMAWRDAKNPKSQRNYSRWVTTYAKDNSLVIRGSPGR
jgi:glycosyltransferase involved in cell wall biosynthesis